MPRSGNCVEPEDFFRFCLSLLLGLVIAGALFSMHGQTWAELLPIIPMGIVTVLGYYCCHADAMRKMRLDKERYALEGSEKEQHVKEE